MSPNSWESVVHGPRAPGDEGPEHTFDIPDPTPHLDWSVLALGWGSRLSPVHTLSPCVLCMLPVRCIPALSPGRHCDWASLVCVTLAGAACGVLLGMPEISDRETRTPILGEHVIHDLMSGNCSGGATAKGRQVTSITRSQKKGTGQLLPCTPKKEVTLLTP